MPGEETKEVAEPIKDPSEIVGQVLAEEEEPEPETDEGKPETGNLKPETEESEEDSETEDSATEDAETEDAEDEDPDNAEAVKDLPEETKARVQKRFGQLTKARKEAEGQVAELESRLETKDSDIADLEDRLEAARKGGENVPVATALMAAVTPKDLNAAEDQLDDLIEWCEDHVDEGYLNEETGEEMRPAEIRKKLRMFRKVESRVVPKAREALKQRSAAETEARKAFPELFDRNKPEGQRYRRMLLDHPELKAVPELPLLLGAAFAHEAGGKAAPKKAAPKKAPAAPAVTPAPKNKGVADPAESKKKTVNLDKVVASGGASDALAGAILEMEII